MNELENLKCGEEMKDELMNVNSSYLALQAFTGDCNKREWKEFGYRCRKEVASPVLLYLALLDSAIFLTMHVIMDCIEQPYTKYGIFVCRISKAINQMTEIL